MRNRSRLGFASLVAALFAGIPAAAQGATIYVSAANVSGVETGSQSSPFKTIQGGLAVAVAGDDVLVSPGVYYGGIELKDQVRLVSSQGPKVTIIDGQGSGTAVLTPSNADNPVSTLDGFTIRNAGLAYGATNRRFFWASNSHDIRNCVIKDVSDGVYASGMTTVRLANTVVSNVTGTAFYLMGFTYTTLTNVTIDRVGQTLLLFQSSVNLDNVTVSNAFSVIYAYHGQGEVHGSHNNFWNYTNFEYGTWWGSGVVRLETSLNADPLFVGAALGKYELSSTSPLIDAGMNVGLPFVGAAPDIGAYEFGANPTPEMAAELLAEAFEAVPVTAYKNAAEQRRGALDNKFSALLKKLASMDDRLSVADKIALYDACLNTLLNDIWAKADGFYGGNPANDWITTQQEQDALYPAVVRLRDAITAERDTLLSAP